MLDVVLRRHHRSKSTGTRSQYASLFGVHRSHRVARRCNPHSCMLLRNGPASVRNLFSRLHWPLGRSIPGSWMVGSLVKDLFGTSTVWFCHRVRQRSWMVRASSGRLDHYRTSRRWSGVKVNIGEQREFSLASCGCRIVMPPVRSICVLDRVFSIYRGLRRRRRRFCDSRLLHVGYESALTLQ